jgi:hypothetical protein
VRQLQRQNALISKYCFVKSWRILFLLAGRWESDTANGARNIYFVKSHGIFLLAGRRHSAAASAANCAPLEILFCRVIAYIVSLSWKTTECGGKWRSNRNIYFVKSSHGIFLLAGRRQSAATSAANCAYLRDVAHEQSGRKCRTKISSGF